MHNSIINTISNQDFRIDGSGINASRLQKESMTRLRKDRSFEGTGVDSKAFFPMSFGTRRRIGDVDDISGSNLSLRRVPLKSRVHTAVFDLVTSQSFSAFILVVILANTCMLISNTFFENSVRAGWYFSLVDTIFLAIYLSEISLKLYVFRWSFFDEGWDVIDFWIVLLNLIDFLISILTRHIQPLQGTTILSLFRIFRTIRAIRALRILRTIRFLSNLQVILITILHSLKSIGTVLMLICLFMYIFAILGREVYSSNSNKYFSSMPTTLLTLFQLLTLDNWFDIYIVTTNNNPELWHIILYLISYIIIEYFICLNLFVAVLVENFQIALETHNIEKNKKIHAMLKENDLDNLEEFEGNNSTSSILSSYDQKNRLLITECYPSFTTKKHTSFSKVFKLMADIEKQHFIYEKYNNILTLMTVVCTEDIVSE